MFYPFKDFLQLICNFLSFIYRKCSYSHINNCLRLILRKFKLLHYLNLCIYTIKSMFNNIIDLILMFLTGRSSAFVSVNWILSTAFMPLTTSPKIVYLPSRWGVPPSSI